MLIKWNDKKNEELKQMRGRNGVGFEDIERAINEQRVIYDIPIHNPIKYPGQRRIVVIIDEYAYVVPYKMLGNVMELITIYPNRNFTKYYLLHK